MTTFAAGALALSLAAPFQTSSVDRLLDAAGVKIHIQCDGDRKPGAPLVLLEAGAGNSANTWRDVIGPIAQFVRVCAYDRPGLGSSERPPYVMAGHSWGGEIVRLYATHYAAEVVGLVLIDSSHEDQVKRFAAIAPAGAVGTEVRSSASAGVPPERADLETMGSELSKNPWHANMPLVVLTRTAPTAENRDERLNVWQELQRDLATRSPQAEHIVAAKSGHYIQNDEPSLVIEAVRRVVAQAAR
jgi:pimeloyl-ACP methyl ester carboxylesterase